MAGDSASKKEQTLSRLQTPLILRRKDKNNGFVAQRDVYEHHLYK